MDDTLSSEQMVAKIVSAHPDREEVALLGRAALDWLLRLEAAELRIAELEQEVLDARQATIRFVEGS